uniref:Uncharacterized protein n=1 Tax=Panagrolaimus sp. ES5 TaxID=591445 RepID=A0AC34FB37_9BILA
MTFDTPKTFSVNFDDIGGFTYGDSSGISRGNYSFHARKLVDGNYVSHSIEDVIFSLPKPQFSFRWLHDDNIVLKVGDDYWKLDTNKADLYGSRKHWINPGQIRLQDKQADFIFNSNSKFIAFGRTASQGFRHSRKCLYDIAQLENGNLSSKKFKLFAEEILNDAKALWWSKSGQYLAYALFDDKNVSKVILPYYTQKPYPTYHSLAYPKAGDAHQPAVFLWIWNKELNTTQMILPPDELIEQNPDLSYYLFSAQWIALEEVENDKRDYLIVVWANRNQNQIFVTACQYGVPCRVLKKLHFSMKGMEMWADPSLLKVEYFSKSGFFMLLPHEYPDGNVYDHIAHIEVIKEGKYFPESGYHGGPYDISAIVGYDKERDEIFFTASGELIGEKHVYRVPYASAEDNVAPQCISCLIENCKNVEVNFAPSGNQMVLFCDAAYQDTVAYLKKTKNILQHWIINDGSKAASFNPVYDIPSIRFDKIPILSGIDANVRLILPPNFNSKYTYPVILHLYAGPNTFMVSNTTPMPLMTYLASIRQYIVVSIDGRGSANRGWKVRAPLYKNLGSPEIDDQINALRFLIQKYPFMDAEKVSAFGWSYGGFASSHIVEKDGGAVVKCSMAVAPVVDFRFYDSAYTERYMLQPNENKDGYLATSLLNSTAIQKFKNVKFFLAHGEADDNVHYQNSALLAMALQDHDIHFTQLVYTNQEHSIKNTRVHLYKEVD